MIRGPIDALDWLHQSLLFAELSSLAYEGESTVRRVAKAMGYHRVRFFDRDGAQAYALDSVHDCVIACRGTEPTQWNDIRADVNAAVVLAETVGKVHRGFKQEVDDLWPCLELALKHNAKPIWFTGHSLGGAMATICAARCLLSNIWSTPSGLFTFGSPRVGNGRYINHVTVSHYRWVNNNDIVTRVPPAWLGFRHSGKEIYLDWTGQIRQISSWQRFRDRLRGALNGLARLRIDHFSDHSITRYVQHIENAVLQQEASRLAASPWYRLWSRQTQQIGTSVRAPFRPQRRSRAG